MLNSSSKNLHTTILMSNTLSKNQTVPYIPIADVHIDATVHLHLKNTTAMSHTTETPCFYKWILVGGKFEKMFLPSVSRKLDPAAPLNNRTVSTIMWASQSRQDRMVFNLLDQKTNGYFVDLAANDWREHSNSYTLERYLGWKGLCIEPNQHYLKGLVENRTCVTIVNPVSNATGEAAFFASNGPFGGIVSNETDVKPKDYIRFPKNKLITVTLTSVLDAFEAPKIMDYLSLDVEGAENWVLQGFDFDKYTFRIISIERPSETVHKMLTYRGYRWLTQAKPPGKLYGECIYVHRSQTVSQEQFKMYQMHRVTDWGVNFVRSFHNYLLTPNWEY